MNRRSPISWIVNDGNPGSAHSPLRWIVSALRDGTAVTGAGNLELAFEEKTLRAIDGFVQILLRDHGNRLDQEAQRIFKVVRDNARKMGQSIDRHGGRIRAEGNPGQGATFFFTLPKERP